MQNIYYLSASLFKMIKTSETPQQAFFEFNRLVGQTSGFFMGSQDFLLLHRAVKEGSYCHVPSYIYKEMVGSKPGHRELFMVTVDAPILIKSEEEDE